MLTLTLLFSRSTRNYHLYEEAQDPSTPTGLRNKIYIHHSKVTNPPQEIKIMIPSVQNG